MHHSRGRAGLPLDAGDASSCSQYWEHGVESADRSGGGSVFVLLAPDPWWQLAGGSRHDSVDDATELPRNGLRVCEPLRGRERLQLDSSAGPHLEDVWLAGEDFLAALTFTDFKDGECTYPFLRASLWACQLHSQKHSDSYHGCSPRATSSGSKPPPARIRSKAPSSCSRSPGTSCTSSDG